MKKVTLIIIIFAFTANIYAQNRGFVAKRIEAKDHIALVIGNSNYPDMPLENPKNDANAVALTFENMGFITEKLIDANHEQMSMAINRFSNKLKTARVAVFYFAGHGIQVNGENYLIPIGRTSGTQIHTEDQVPYRAINVGEVLASIESNKVKFSLIVLDACRNNPIKGSGRGKLKGLASIDAPAGSLVMYSTKAGGVAADGTGKNSPFTTAFLQHITTPGLDINLLPSRVTKTVRELTNNQQTPGSYVQITQSFTFVPQLTDDEIEGLKRKKEDLAKKIKQQQYKNEAERKKQQQELEKLKAELTQVENYDKENAEIEKKQAEIEALDQQIENMKKASSEGIDNLDQMLVVLEKRKKQKANLEELKRKAETERLRKKNELEQKKQKAEEDRKKREREIADIKQQKFDENIAKYNKIANSELGQDMKPAAWNSVLKNLGIAKGSIKIGDVSALKVKFYNLPTQIIDKRDGKTYKLVYIGTQVWFKQNLAYKTGSGCRAYKKNQSNVSKYGYLYNWRTAKTVCPSGWHLPSDKEWTKLANYLGGEEVAGIKLKIATNWKLYNGKNYGNNESGFNALPGGYFHYDANNYNYGSFWDIGSSGYWWSSTSSGNGYAWKRSLNYHTSKVSRSQNNRKDGYSVRCIKD